VVLPVVIGGDHQRSEKKQYREYFFKHRFARTN
jgi:hypothetical protein